MIIHDDPLLKFPGDNNQDIDISTRLLVKRLHIKSMMSEFAKWYKD